MISKAQVLGIARTAVGLCIAAGLIYFLYSKDSPPAVSALIMLAVVFFIFLRRRSGVFDGNPYFREIAKLGSSSPLRDLGKALICFVMVMVVTITGALGVKHQVIPDNYLTTGIIGTAIIGGALGVGIFLFRAFIPLMFGRRR